MPLNHFVEEPVTRMKVVDDSDRILEIQREVIEIARDAECREIKMGALERFAFYEAASKGVAVVRTSQYRPYGCFLFRMSVIIDRGLLTQCPLAAFWSLCLG